MIAALAPSIEGCPSLLTLSPFIETAMAIVSYKINIRDTAIEKFKQRLSVTDLPDELDK